MGLSGPDLRPLPYPDPAPPVPPGNTRDRRRVPNIRYCISRKRPHLTLCDPPTASRTRTLRLISALVRILASHVSRARTGRSALSGIFGVVAGSG